MRRTGQGGGGPGPSISSRALEAEKARLARFFESIHKHARALEAAIQDNFGGELDPTAWKEAFESAEPDDANRTMVVTGDHSAVLNSYVELLRTSAGSRLLGLVPYRRPHVDQALEAIRADGGLTGEQAKLLNQLYVLEGRLEHASPDVGAEEVRDAVERLQRELPRLIESTRDWLRDHGVEPK